MITRICAGSYKGLEYGVYKVEAGAYSMTVTNVGCAVMTLHAPDRDGRLADVVLGYDTVEEYIDKPKFFGAVIGRVGNRIRNAAFQLDGKTYHVAPTSPDGTSLHGGPQGFDKKAFSAQIGTYAGREALIFHYLSPDGEEGYPGNLNLTVIYTLSEDGALTMKYIATTDKPTLCNITNHSFFNLGGHDSGTILDNVLTLSAKYYTVCDKSLNTTGEIAPVAGTALDFTSSARSTRTRRPSAWAAATTTTT